MPTVIEGTSSGDRRSKNHTTCWIICIAFALPILAFAYLYPFEVPVGTGVTYDGLSGKHLHLLVSPGREHIINVYLVDTTPYSERYLHDTRRSGVTLNQSTVILGNYRLPMVYALFSEGPPDNDFRPRSRLDWDPMNRWARSNTLPDSIVKLDSSDRLMVIVELVNKYGHKYVYVSKNE